MSVKITWDTSPGYSAIHAASVLCGGNSIVDAAVGRAVAETVESLRDRLAIADMVLDAFWTSLIALQQNKLDDRVRVERSLIVAGCGELAADSMAATIAGELSDFRIAYSEALPKLADQLPLRAGPLKEQWEARGPGLLAAASRLTHPSLMPTKSRVALVQPSAGGGGGANPNAGFVWIEAVLANPNMDIPEVVRLGWLLARTGLGRKGSSRLVESDRMPELASLALLPIFAQAAEETELAYGIDVERLMEAWNLRRHRNPETIEKLTRWWAQLQSGETPFPVGLKALDKMLHSDAASQE